MDKWFLIIGIVLVTSMAAIISVICLYRRRMRRLMDSLTTMLDSAIDGDFIENTFDESVLSAVEAKMARFLSACAVSSKNLAAEKENIQRLISDISHQTKTPVANILLYSQILSEHKLRSDSAVCVKELSAQAEKLDFLMVALVKASRLESGIIVMNPQRNTMRELLDAVITQIRPKAEEKEITIDTELSDGSAYYDPKWTVEAVYNVLDNAVKYSPRQSTIKVYAISYELFFRIDITDQGIGIAEDEQEKIFTRFYRSAKVSGYEGVGLGLFLAREIISGGGGYIKVSRAKGQGSAFSIFLPTEKR